MDKAASQEQTGANVTNAQRFTYEEAFESTKEYFIGNKLAANVWCDKYAVRDKEGLFLEKTPDQMHDRLAAEFARIDVEKYGYSDYEARFKIYRDATDKFEKSVLQGSPMAAVGNTQQVMSASNCVVVEPPHDSIAGIMKTGTELAQLYKRRCGVGTDLSGLRPDGFHVNNAARTTSGAWSFADYYSYITRMIGQSGRRGALILTLNVHHPDVEKFVRMKADLKKVTGANVSIRLSDEFLQAVEDNTTYEQCWPCEDGVKPVWTKQVSAKQVWDIIVETATTTAEPGLIFWSKMISRLPAHSYPQFKTRSTNPCAELPLSSYDSCRLLSLNLTGFVSDAFTEKASFKWKSFDEHAHLSMQMLDNLVDIELELVEKIQSVCCTDEERNLWKKLWQAGHDGRRTGLGTHGLADCLAQIGIKYDSEEALEFADKLSEFLRNSAYLASIELAEKRGAFPAFDWEIEKNNEYIQDLPEELKERLAKTGRRNISILTQAPTGSISMLSKTGEFNRFGVSSGVEPVFRNNYTRRKKINAGDIHTRVDYTDDMGDTWQNFEICHNNVLNYFEKIHGAELDDLENPDTQALIHSLTKDLPNYFVTSDQVDWKFRVALQGREQHWIDHSISSTINCPKGTTSDTVGGIYLASWKAGLKGVTVYVDGSRDGVLVTEDSAKIDPNVRPEKIIRLQSPKRPKKLPCDIHQHTVKGEKWTAIVGLLDGEPYELFGGYSNAIHLPKKYNKGFLKRRARGKYDLIIPVSGDSLVVRNVVGTFNDPDIGWTTRLISTALRHGTPITFLTEQLSKSGNITSFSRVLARVLKKYIPNGEKVKTNIACGRNCDAPDLIYTEGCVTCTNCAWTLCS